MVANRLHYAFMSVAAACNSARKYPEFFRNFIFLEKLQHCVHHCQLRVGSMHSAEYEQVFKLF